MLFIVDKKIPGVAKKSLCKFGELLEFSTDGITDEYLSGHPDIFFCKAGEGVIYSPDVDEKYLHILRNTGITLIPGRNKITKGYPECARYNAVITNEFLIHNLNITEDEISSFASSLRKIDVKQGFTRCSLLHIKDKYFITSDKGLEKILNNSGNEVLYVTPEDIELPGCKYGFIGGCAGIDSDKVFFVGSLKYKADGKKIKSFINDLNMEVVELYDGPFFDGGSVLII